MPRIAISDELVVGPPPENVESIRRLADDGFQAILNLRPTNAASDFSSRDEGLAAVEQDLTYLCAPLPSEGLDDFSVRSVITKLDLLPKPIFMHADQSSKAAVIGLIDSAVSKNWSVSDTLKQADELGLETDDTPEIHEFVERFVDA